MENRQTPAVSKEKKIEDNKLNEEKESNSEDAGPSGTIALPGAVTNKPKLGSKSEHSIRQIITTKDVALALNSLNFITPNQNQRINVNEIKLPISEKENEGDPTTNTLIDLKKFMASCFKLNKDAPTSEMPLQSVQTQGNETQEVVDATTCNVQTACLEIQSLPNEVIVTNTIEPKLSKSEKKKNSGNISERSELAAPRDSLSSIGSNVCRICMTRGRERLISPCNCKGSLANVHLSCLERWLNQVGRNHCELCGYSYPAIRTPRYTVLQALRLWFGNPRNRSHLQSDCLIFWLLSTVTAGLLAVCIVGTQYFVIEGNKFGKIDAGARKEEGISHRITETAMDFFMAIVLCGYSVTVYLLWKDHYVMWNRWRRANVNVRLLLAPDVNPVPFSPRNRYNVV